MKDPMECDDKSKKDGDTMDIEMSDINDSNSSTNHDEEDINIDQIENCLESSLNQLFEAIEKMVQTDKQNEASTPQDQRQESLSFQTYKAIHILASKVFSHLQQYGKLVEMSLMGENNRHTHNSKSSEKDDIVESDKKITFLTEQKREYFYNKGKQMWMLVRNHPEHFIDRYPSTVVSTEEKEDALTMTHVYCTVAGGFIRAIAARLILIDYICTRGKHIPDLGQSNKTPVHEGEKRRYPSATEMEFGLKCFGRAGRAVLFYIESWSKDSSCAHANDAFSILSLASNFFKAILCLVENREESNDEYRELMLKNKEEGFDAISLLPDAAYHYNILTGSDGLQNDGDDEDNIVVKLLHEFKSLLSEFEQADRKNDIKQRSSQLCLARFLPCLARVSYKQGNRYAKVGAFSIAKECLGITLQSTDDFLTSFRSLQENSHSDSNESDINVQVQEQEMLVLSKEAFHVLSYTCQALGQFEEAEQYLYRVEQCITQQSNRDDALYKDILKDVKNVETRESLDTSKMIKSLAFFSTDLALLDSKNQDKIDIIGRAQAARAKARIIESKERANLAYSRIMICLQSPFVASNNAESTVEEQLLILLNLSDKLSTEQKTDEFQNPLEDNFLQLTLSATRQVFIQRFSCSTVKESRTRLKENESHQNPYKLLLSKYQFDTNEKSSSFKHLYFILDQIAASLTIIQQTSNEKNADEVETALGNTIQKLDNQCIKASAKFFENLENLLSTHDTQSRSLSDSLLSSHDMDMEQYFWLMKEYNSNCARAISMYRTSENLDYSRCASWCNALIISLSKGDLFKSKCETTCSQTVKKHVHGEVLAIKAHSLTMIGQYREGLQNARNSWKKFHQNPKPKDLVILFHCSAAYEAQNRNNDYNSLLEFDDAISQLLMAASTEGKNALDKVTDEIMMIFPILSSSCIEIETEPCRPILLGLQERWIDMLLKANSSQNALFDGTTVPVPKPPADASIFCVLRAYLCNFEDTVGNPSEENTQGLHRQYQALLNTLGSVLDLLCSIRDSSKSNEINLKKNESKIICRENNEEKLLHERSDGTNIIPHALIWDNPNVVSIVGDYHDCVWVAEQIWNLGIQTMTNRAAKTILPLNWFSAQLFAKAHDFALLSEEEKCAGMSRGFLDHEQNDSQEMHEPSNQEGCSELSSEFSAQCLLLSVANTVDDFHHHLSLSDKNVNENELKSRFRKCINRLIFAKKEFDLNLETDQIRQREYIQSLIVWLTLRCLVETGDDDACLAFLDEKSTLEHLEAGTPMFQHEKLKETLNQPLEKKIHGESSLFASTQDHETCIIVHIFLCSKRAEINHMLSSAAYLLQFCSQKMKEYQCSKIRIDRNQLYSLGDIQRKLIYFGSNVSQVVKIFEGISRSVENIAQNNDGNWQMYSVDDFDWFSIEAYNRGVNLVFLGDIRNAERLIAIALNLLSFCGRQVESYGSEMRMAYREIVERKMMTSPQMSSSTVNIMQLFDKNHM